VAQEDAAARFSDGHGQTRDIDLIGDLAQSMMGRTFCPLGDAAAMPTIAIVEEVQERIREYVARNPFATPELVSIARRSMAARQRYELTGSRCRPKTAACSSRSPGRTASRSRPSAHYEGMSLQAACRMCLVEVERRRS
jgi:hypothetical protein